MSKLQQIEPCRKDENFFSIVIENGKNVEATFDLQEESV